MNKKFKLVLFNVVDSTVDNKEHFGRIFLLKLFLFSYVAFAFTIFLFNHLILKKNNNCIKYHTIISTYFKLVQTNLITKRQRCLT